MKSSFGLLLLLLPLLVACGGDDTHITVEVSYDGPLEPGAMLTVVASREGAADSVRRTDPSFPETLTIVPGDGSGPVEAMATLTNGSTSLAASGQASFIDGEEVVLRLRLGEPAMDAGITPDSGTAPSDAGPSDSGIPDAAPSDAAPPDAGSGTACDILEVDGMPIVASAIASISTDDGEFIATSRPGGMTRLFHRRDSERCFTQRATHSTPLDNLHLSRRGNQAMLVGSANPSSADPSDPGTYAFPFQTNAPALPAREEIATAGTRIVVAGVIPAFLSSMVTSERRVALAQRGNQIAAATQVDPPIWIPRPQINRHKLWAISGNVALVHNDSTLVAWTLSGGTDAANGNAPTIERRESRIAPSGAMEASVNAAAIIGVPSATVALVSFGGVANVDACTPGTESWACTTLMLPDAQSLTGDNTKLLDGNTNHWTIVRGHRDGGFAGYHFLRNARRTLVIDERPEAIASLSIGFAYIDGSNRVRIRRR